MRDADADKVNKTGYATPRGGEKGAYQNHVTRDNKVIIPYERIEDVELDAFQDGYVVRLFPSQYFNEEGGKSREVENIDTDVSVGENAFILYRSRSSFQKLPPKDDWEIRWLERDGEKVDNRTSRAEDRGHYVIRFPGTNSQTKRVEGPPQGIFAPEYATNEDKYLSQCLLAWLITQTLDSPYTEDEYAHLEAILEEEDILEYDFRSKGIIRDGICTCPLCRRPIVYEELHNTVSFDEEDGLSNAGVQIQEVTRSTSVNLFHLKPLVYHELRHAPDDVAWGHASCNTRLGQRRCYSISELKDQNHSVYVSLDDGNSERIGYASRDRRMIRSNDGAVWIKINEEFDEDPLDRVTEFFAEEETVDDN